MGARLERNLPKGLADWFLRSPRFWEPPIGQRIESAMNRDIHNAGESESSVPSDFTRIKDLIQRFRVCWEAHPEQVLTTSHSQKEIRKIGFALELYGTHEPGAHQVRPGCKNCRRVQSALMEIANWILPREKRPSFYEVDMDTQSLSYSRSRGDRPDVRLTIQILHRNDWDRPIDECEMRCLKEMEQALGELGACQGTWISMRQAAFPSSQGGANGR